MQNKFDWDLLYEARRFFYHRIVVELGVTLSSIYHQRNKAASANEQQSLPTHWFLGLSQPIRGCPLVHLILFLASNNQSRSPSTPDALVPLAGGLWVHTNVEPCRCHGSGPSFWPPANQIHRLAIRPTRPWELDWMHWCVCISLSVNDTCLSHNALQSSSAGLSHAALGFILLFHCVAPVRSLRRRQ